MYLRVPLRLPMARFRLFGQSGNRPQLRDQQMADDRAAGLVDRPRQFSVARVPCFSRFYEKLAGTFLLAVIPVISKLSPIRAAMRRTFSRARACPAFGRGQGRYVKMIQWSDCKTAPVMRCHMKQDTETR